MTLSLARTTFATTDSFAPTVARVILGAVLLPHGLQHALGLLSGYGFSGTLGWMTHTLGFPAALAALAIITELLAPIALLIGLLGRLAALGVAFLMLTAATTHVTNGFFMNWFGALPAGKEGFEYHLLAVALALVVMLEGSGTWSLDRILSRRRPQSTRGSSRLVAAAH